MYSVQQLLFDCMSYLKEFGADGRSWQVGAIGTSRPEGGNYVVWLHRPALSQRAAEAVVERLRYRFGLQPLAQPHEAGRFVFLAKQPCRN